MCNVGSVSTLSEKRAGSAHHTISYKLDNYLFWGRESEHSVLMLLLAWDLSTYILFSVEHYQCLLLPLELSPWLSVVQHLEVDQYTSTCTCVHYTV